MPELVVIWTSRGGGGHLGDLSCGWTRPSSGHWVESREAGEGVQRKTSQKFRRLLGHVEKEQPREEAGC